MQLNILFLIYYIYTDGGLALRKVIIFSLSLTLIFFVSAIFCQFYYTTSTGYLPVISYPLQIFTIPFAVIGVILAVTTLILGVMLPRGEVNE